MAAEGTGTALVGGEWVPAVVARVDNEGNVSTSLDADVAANEYPPGTTTPERDPAASPDSTQGEAAPLPLLSIVMIGVGVVACYRLGRSVVRDIRG